MYIHTHIHMCINIYIYIYITGPWTPSALATRVMSTAGAGAAPAGFSAASPPFSSSPSCLPSLPLFLSPPPFSLPLLLSSLSPSLPLPSPPSLSTL